MPYRPRVENRAGEIYAGGIKNAAAYEAAGIKESGALIAKGIKVAGSELGAGIEKAGDIWARQAEQKKAEADLWSALNTKIDTMGHYGYITGRDADALAGIKKPNDLAAALTVIEQDIGRRQQQEQQAAQEKAMFQRWYTQKALERQQEALDKQNSAQPGDTKVIVDPVTGKKTSYVFQNSAQIIPLNEEKNTNTPVTGVKKQSIGNGQFIYTDQAGNMIDPKKIQGSDTASETQTTLEALKIKRAELTGEVAKGNKKRGADWMPGLTSETQPYESQIKGIDAQIAALEGGEQPSAIAPPTSVAHTYSNAEAVRSAYKSGEFGDLSDPKSKAAAQAAATKILREHFGYE
jgi:hypothetical protein